MQVLLCATAVAALTAVGCGGSSAPQAPPPGPTAAQAWSVPLDAAMYARPLVAGNLVIAATENNTVYAVDPATGRLRWRHHLAAPARRTDLPCGNIDPSGITGTPAYDPSERLVFAATEDRDARHTLHALDLATGRTRWTRPLDVIPGRDRHAEQQRGALLVTAGRVYVPFGGRFGDCGNYVGYLAAVPVTGNGATLRYAMPTARGAGIWAAPGPVLGPGGDIYVATGNGAQVGGRYDGSDSVIRLSTSLQRKALFAPTTWPEDNAQDLDLGSMSPVVVAGKLLVAGKRGVVYLLSPDLGGIGGQLARIDGCAGYGGAAVSGTTVLLPCDSGVRALRVDNSTLKWLWHNGDLHGSPAVSGPAVYAFAGSDLVTVELRDGHVRRRVHIGDVTRFAAPVPSGGLVLVGTTTNLVAVRT